MHDSGRVNVFQPSLEAVSDAYKDTGLGETHQDLVQEILDELLLQRPRREQSM